MRRIVDATAALYWLVDGWFTGYQGRLMTISTTRVIKVFRM